MVAVNQLRIQTRGKAMEAQRTLDDAFRDSERERVRKVYSKARPGKDDGFISADDLVTWWMQEIEESSGCCAYCGTSIMLIRALIGANKLEVRKIGYGYRGPNLELEQKDPHRGYTRDNCDLASYYCNNDKSYIYGEHEYRKFLDGRNGYILNIWPSSSRPGAERIIEKSMRLLLRRPRWSALGR